MKKLLISAAFIATIASPYAAANGALAIDSNQGSQYGFSYDHSSMGEAQNRALNECGHGCRIVKTFSSGCAAYAADQTSGSSVYSWGTGPSSSLAQSNAMRHCRDYGGSQCSVRVWGCNSR